MHTSKKEICEQPRNKPVNGTKSRGLMGVFRQLQGRDNSVSLEAVHPTPSEL